MEQYYGLTAEMYRAVVALVDDRIKEMRLTRQDFDGVVRAQERVEGRMERVEAALERLAQAQARTEERVERLEEGQAALQQGQAAMQAAIRELAEAQARTEERVERLEEGQAALQQGQAAMQAAIRELAEAQARTEERVERLEEGQAAMQAAIRELAEAQARTEERMGRLETAMEKLAQTQAQLSQEIGGLRMDIGYGLEDVARLLLPPYLHKHYGIQLEGPEGEELQPRFFPRKGYLPDEINLYGEGWRNGQRVVVLGEAKAKIGGGVVSDFAKVLERVEPQVEGEVWRVMFGYYIHPSAQPIAKEKKILLIASYQR